MLTWKPSVVDWAVQMQQFLQTQQALLLIVCGECMCAQKSISTITFHQQTREQHQCMVIGTKRSAAENWRQNTACTTAPSMDTLNQSKTDKQSTNKLRIYIQTTDRDGKNALFSNGKNNTTINQDMKNNAQEKQTKTKATI